MEKKNISVSVFVNDGKKIKELSKEEVSKKVKITVVDETNRKLGPVVKITRLTKDEINDHVNPKLKPKPSTSKSTEQQTKQHIPRPQANIHNEAASTSNSTEQQPMQYILRHSKRKADETVGGEKKKVCKEIAKTECKPKFISAPRNSLQVGMIVLAWMRTYSPWPAKLLVLKKTTADVLFMGDQTKGTVNIEKLGLIGENSALIKHLSLKSIKDYRKAVLEAERLQGVPDHLSVLNVITFLSAQFNFV